MRKISRLSPRAFPRLIRTTVTALHPSEAPPPTRPPGRFTALSWVAMLGGALVTGVIYGGAVAMRRPGDWLPGIGQLLIGTLLTSAVAFGCGLVALIRREQRCWVALVPFLTGLGFLTYFGSNLLRNALR